MSSPPFADLIEDPPWQDALELLLGPSFKLLFSGAVIAVGELGEERADSELETLRPRDVPSMMTWLTAGLPSLKRATGRLYYEVLLQDDPADADPQLGWLSEEFQLGELDMNGVGDDAHGWAADGVRHAAWHGGQNSPVEWPQAWEEDDVVGCAVDFEVGQMRFSLNGEWCNSAAMSFDVAGRAMYPAVSFRGDFSLQILEEDWRFQPPEAGYEAWAKEGGSFARPARKAQPQGWHQDSEPLFSKSASGGVALPAHCVNVFVPLIDLTEANGATAFAPGSHLLDKGVELDLQGVVQPAAEAGTATIFDVRLAHRGGANNSGMDRTILYFTYAAPWFRDPANHRSDRMLFEEAESV